ncbi:MAG: hypothetical protein IKC64_00960 [Clostridia bacterium]|nr:hypothetical protein [Clostridia bacterium]
MKYCFTVDDNIIFLKDLTRKNYDSVFNHPYLSVYKRLHEKYGLKIQLNLFFRDGEFDLTEMSEKYKDEWESCADWLKFSFHSNYENVKPYENSPYEEVYADIKKVNDEILRFAGEKSLAKTTTIHYCLTTRDGVKAIKDNAVVGLLGLFGTSESPKSSYSLVESVASKIRNGEIVCIDGMSFGAIDLIVNAYSQTDGLNIIKEKLGKNPLKVMIHEQYFYPTYFAYQPDFEEKLDQIFSILAKNGYESKFFEDFL